MLRIPWPWRRRRFNYLIAATNRLNRYRRKLDNRTALEIPDGTALDYLREACSAIRTLAADKDFRLLIEIYSNQKDDRLLEALVDDLDRIEGFLDAFIVIECEEMRRAGLDPAAIETLMGERDQLLAALRDDSDPNVTFSLDSLNRVENIVCSKARFDTNDAIVSTLEHATYIAGGAAIMVIDIFADASLGGIATKLSYKLGGSVATKGVRDLINRFRAG